ncbi:MAG: ABC transporter permease [Gammaproteobacteria bacterium]|nr:ABC transporter permease [Gammaproteobacteria bacterium]
MRSAAAQPVLLWTDILIYVLVFSILLFALYARAHEHLRAPWRQVKRRRLGMMSLVILSAYTTVGLLDSVHFKQQVTNASGEQRSTSGEVLSVLDVIAAPLREHDERTYSAPFATHAYVKEMVQHADGTQSREFPPLKFGGAHLKNPELERSADIGKHALLGLLVGLVLAASVMGLLTVWLSRCEHIPFSTMLRRIVRGETDTPWHVVLATLAVIIVLVSVSSVLASKYHIFGTDKVGQDVFFEALKSIRTGLVIGTLTTLIMLPFAVLLGIMAGYFRGWIDDVIQYIYTTLNSIPGVLLIAAAVLLVQVYLQTQGERFDTVERADLRLLFLCMILGITNWTGLCRMLRGESLKLRELDYIQSATALGVGHFTIIGRHILPNVMHIVLIAVVLDFSGLVLAEAVLSYVGVGVDPTMNSWGNMINQARLEMAREPMVWWSLTAAFVFMFVLVLAANLFSDAVRDAFDPRLRERS